MARKVVKSPSKAGASKSGKSGAGGSKGTAAKAESSASEKKQDTRGGVEGGRERSGNSNGNENGEGGGVPPGVGRGRGSVLFRLLFLLVPMIQMLWTAEAPRRPFGAIRDPETELFRMKEVSVATTAAITTTTTAGAGAGDGTEVNTEIKKIYELINPRVLTVVTTPRDVMSFVVTLGLMEDQERRDYSEVFVLSVGAGADGADGGEKDGWGKVLDVVGIDKDRRFILDAREDVEEDWEPEKIAKKVEPFVIENAIDTILTYDTKSSNPHRTNVSDGIKTLLFSPSLASHVSLLASQPGASDTPRIHPRAFHLTSYPLYRSFFGPITPIFERFALAFYTIRSDPGKAHANGEKVPTVFVTDLKGFGKNWRALAGIWKYLDRKELAESVFGRNLWVNQWIEA